ncbi:unnamed protein product [Medioppia subpectinata]|uniref:Uncharacterized protein n=1 Tax=Medioppia subpectinata TaxID=1979941 RepID=A0A7R9Q016_9ACAR|nr:unnamed protein product [Medioppia subpectinata]CAG2107066.1 unnamed protein product [Medioppia subpectinata]
MSAKDIYSEVKKSRDFTKKVILVTGSSGGIGEAIAKLYSALGASVVITGRREAIVKRVAKEAQELSPNKTPALEIPADLGKNGEAERVFNETIKTFKRLDVLVNNAGDYIKANGTDDNFLDVLDRSLKVDLKASLTLIRLFEPYLKQSKGNVVNISSVFTERPQKSYLGYQLAKQALEMSTTTLALELAPHGIRVNSVGIGIVRSHVTHDDPNVMKIFNEAAKQTPLGRIGTPDDIAKGVVFLSSSDASFITGHNLVIDGGINNDIYQEVRDSRNFTGKIVLVTGSASGIGEQIVKLYSALGASVVVTGRKASEISKVAKEVQELSPKKLKPLEVTADLTKDEDLKRLFDETIKAYKGLDVLVNSAGLLINSSATDKDFLSVLDKSEKIDLRASLELIRLSVPYLQKSKGTVVNICSTFTIHPQKSYLGYELAKQALSMATNVLSLELAPQGIRVNSISPGIVQSHPLNETLPWEKRVIEKAAKTTPLARPGLPIDIAKGIVFLSSSDASFITGHNLVVDGGLRYNMDSDFMNV